MTNQYRSTFQCRSVEFANLFPSVFHEVRVNLSEALDEFSSINIHSEGAAVTWFLVSSGVVSFDDNENNKRIEEIRRFMMCYFDVRMDENLDALNDDFGHVFGQVAMRAYRTYRMPAKRPR